MFSRRGEGGRGRPTEVDCLKGAVVREARRVGVPAPIHETLYRLVKARELGWKR